MVGAPGVVNGIPAAESETVPVPSAVTARSLTVYVVPFAKPEMTIGEVVAGGLRTCHVEPPSVEN